MLVRNRKGLIMKVFIRKKKKQIKECDGGEAGALTFGMGNPGPGSGDRFDMGFGTPKKKKIKVKKKSKKK